MSDFQSPFEVSEKWSFDPEVKWGDFVFVDDDSAELVIRLSDGRPDSYLEVADLIVTDGGELVDTVSLDGKVVAVVADMSYDALSFFASKVKAMGLARYVEPNIKFKIDSLPNDPDWPKQWGPQKIEADWAWNTTMGDPSVLVAVVDTGIDWNHPDLVDNYVPLGYDWVNNDPDPMDDHGHGTHCAGVIAAVINNNIGIAGLAQVRVMAEKGLDADGSGRLSDLANAIIHAVDQGANIISCSWGSYIKSTLLHEAIKYAYDHGVLVVAAAGNDATDTKHYPAAYDEVFAVTATDQNDDPASFTNFGNWVEAGAPGVRIYSTVWDDSYTYMSGTSMSTPHVSGVAALIWSRFPNMTRDQVWAQLQYTADDLGSKGFDVYYGFGRINARKAVEQVPAEHDVLILNWQTPTYTRLGNAATVNTTILNMGTSDERDITIQLLANSSVVDSVIVNFLAKGSSTSVSCSWTPTVGGTYNVTSYIVPVTGETVTDNNALSVQIKVRIPKIIKVPDDYDTIQKAIDAAFEGDTVFVASGIYYENVWINKEDLTLIGEDPMDTIIDGRRKADVVLVTADGIKISKFTLKNSYDSLSYAGVFVFGVNGITINEVTTLDNYHGIFLYSVSNATLRNNNMTRNMYNFGVYGDGLKEFNHDIDASNIVDGKPLYYWVNEHDKNVPSDAGYVAVVNSTNIVVKDLNLTKNFEGVLFAYTVNSLIENVNASDNYFGVYFAYSRNNSVHSNILMNNYAGIHLHESQHNNVNEQHPINNENGISLYYSKNNAIDSNELVNNNFGLLLEKSDNNTISNNAAFNNTYGVIIQRSGYNTFRDNNMTANVYNFGVTGNYLSHFIQDVDVSNTVNGKPIYYWVNQKDKEIPSDAGYVAVVNSTNVTVRDLNLTQNVQGVLFAFTAESVIENVKAINNTYGIYLYGSSNNAVVDNTATSKGKLGIQLVNSNNNIVSNNLLANNYIGIGLWLFSENNTISWNTLLNGTSGGVGLYLDGSNSNTIGNNAITNNYEGIILYRSGMNTLRNNNMTNNSYNFGVYGSSLLHYLNDVDTSNTVNEKPIYYWINQHDIQVPTNAGYVAVINSTGVIAKNLDLSKNEQGILFAYTTNSAIMNVTASYNYNGFYLWRSNSNSIKSNNVINNDWDGIGLYYSDNNTITGNTVTDNGIGINATVSYYNDINSNIVLRNIIGIYLYYSYNNTVVKNKVTGGALALAGIALTRARGNIISENVVSENQFFIGAGIYLEWSSNDNTIIENTLTNNYYGISIGYWGLYGLKDQNNNNMIYHNNLVRNTKQVLSLNSVNMWDDGYPSCGNYWSDYIGADLYSGTYQNATGSDGIGDAPYVIDENNRDRYPLMKPWGPIEMVFNVIWDGVTYPVAIISNSTVNNFNFSQPLKQISFNVAGPDSTIGFCNVTIPKELLYGKPWTVLIDGISSPPATTENATHSILYFTYRHSTHKIQVIGTYVITPPPPLTVSISPLSASMLVGQSLTFTSTVSGGYTPYSYQWYLNGNPIPGAISEIWTFTPTTSGIFYIYLKVTDAKGNTAQSETARIVVSTVPVGGYSTPININTKAEPLTPHIILITILTIAFTTIKRKTTRKTKQPP
jgi:parallel beta-helix repeat protein